jgi:hypothetical protein
VSERAWHLEYWVLDAFGAISIMQLNIFCNVKRDRSHVTFVTQALQNTTPSPMRSTQKTTHQHAKQVLNLCVTAAAAA